MHLQTPVPRSRLPGTNASVRLQPAKKNRLRYLKQREFKARSWLTELLGSHVGHKAQAERCLHPQTVVPWKASPLKGHGGGTGGCFGAAT